MIKALLFDLDETLLNQEEASAAALRVFHEIHCADQPWEEVKRRWEFCLEQHFERYVAGAITFQQQRRCRIRDIFDNRQLDDAAADALFSTYLAAYEKNYALFPDVLPFFEEVRGFLFGVITNGETHQQRDKLVRMGIHALFGTVLISGEVGLRKPDPEIFRAAARRLKVLPQECVFIGDNLEADYHGSRKAGMVSVWINRRSKPSPPGVLEISSFSEIPALLQAMEAAEAGAADQGRFRD